MKRYTALLLVAVMAFGIVACTDTKEKESRKVRRSSDVEETEDTEESEETKKTEETETTETTEVTDGPGAIDEPIDENLYIDAYLDKLEELNAEDDDGDRTYDLLHIDEDDIPELVMNDYCTITVFTYHDGQLIEIIDGWSYGAMGNTGYYYAPYQNYMSNTNSDYAGMLYCTSTYSLDGNYEWEPGNCGNIQFFETNPEEHLDEPLYFLNNEEVTEEEYDAAFPIKDNRLVTGKYYYDEMKVLLESEQIPEEHSFKVFTDNLTWEEAQAKCEEMGGYLATLDNIYYTLLLNDYPGYVFYVGGTYNENLGEYTWSTDGSNGSIPAYMWMDGEPTFTGKTEDGREVEEKYLCLVCLVVEGNVTLLRLMDVPNDVLDAAPSYEGHLGYICEFDHYIKE